MSLLFQALQDLGSERELTPSRAPGEAIEFLRCVERKASLKSEAALKQPTDGDLRTLAEAEPHPRTVAWPQVVGALSDTSEPSTALADAAEPAHTPPTAAKRIAAVLRMVLPFVERTLPLLEGTPGATGSNLAAPQGPAASPEPQTSDVARIVENIAEFKAQYNEMSDQVVEQNASLKRAENGLGLVREATERNTREQQELIEDLRGVGNKVNFLSLMALGLLGITLVINIALFLHIFNIRP